jgi:hypothetical protein
MEFNSSQPLLRRLKGGIFIRLKGISGRIYLKIF